MCFLRVGCVSSFSCFIVQGRLLPRLKVCTTASIYSSRGRTLAHMWASSSSFRPDTFRLIPIQDVCLAALYVSTKMHDTLKKPKDILTASYAVRFPEKALKSKTLVREVDVDPQVWSVKDLLGLGLTERRGRLWNLIDRGCLPSRG
jgi:hypothetical protein